MSEQPPLTPPSGPLASPSGPPPPPTWQPPAGPPPVGPSGSFEPYGAPAYGDVGPEEPPTQAAPGQGAAGWAPYPVSPQGAPYQLAPQYLGRPGAPTHPLATTSLVLGIIGLFSLLLTPILFVTLVGALCSPFAIWLGVRAKREIRAQPLAYSGEGVATGGFVTGIIGVVLGIIALILIVIFFAFLAAVISSV